MTVTSAHRSGERAFAHTIAVIESDTTVRADLVPEIRRSLRRRQPVLMVVGEAVAEVVRAELGAPADGLEWGDPTAFYQRLGSAYESFRQYLAHRHAAGHQVHVVAEPELADTVAAGPLADRACAYLPYESMCNEAYAPYGSPVTCVWDARRHPADILREARSVHGHVLTPAGRVRNPAYRAPEEYLAGRTGAPPPAPAGVDHDVTVRRLDDLGPLRRTLAAWTGRHCFQASVAYDVGIAVTEIVTNALRHGGTPARVRAWHQHDTLIVQVDDGGGHPLPPTAGYRRPAATAITGGRGLWLARQLADTVTVHTTPGRTCVRLFFPYQVMHRGAA